MVILNIRSWDGFVVHVNALNVHGLSYIVSCSMGAQLSWKVHMATYTEVVRQHYK